MANKTILRSSWHFFVVNLVLVWIFSLLCISSISHWYYTDIAIERSFVWSLLIPTLIGYMGGIFLIYYLLLVVPAQLIFRHKLLQIVISAVAVSLFLLFIIGDSQIYRLFHLHINSFYFKVLLKGEINQWFSFSHIETYLILAVITVVVVFQLLLARYMFNQQSHKKIRAKSVITILALIVLSALGSFFLFSLHTRFDVVNRQDINFYQAKYSAYDKALVFPNYINTYLTLPFIKTNRQFLELMGRDIATIRKSNQKQLYYPKKQLSVAKQTKAPNIFIIVIDTWRKDTVSESLMPNVYQFSRDAVQYKNHYSGGNSTYAGLFSLFFSLPPTLISSIHEQKLEAVLLNVLSQMDYKIELISSSILGTKDYIETMFYDKKVKSIHPRYTPDVRDKAAVSIFIDSLPQKSEKSFNFILLDTAHGFCEEFSFVPLNKNYISQCNRLFYDINKKDLYLNRYTNALHYVDSQVGNLLQAIKNKGLYQDALIIITGDHGESFFDYANQPSGHGANYSAYQLQTPLFIKWPQSKGAGKKITFKTSHYDIVPTLIADVFKVQTPVQYYSVGNSLLRNTNNKQFFIAGSYIDYGIVGRVYTYVVSPTGRLEVFDNNSYQKAFIEKDMELLDKALKEQLYFYKPLKHGE